MTCFYHLIENGKKKFCTSTTLLEIFQAKIELLCETCLNHTSFFFGGLFSLSEYSDLIKHIKVNC